MAAPRHLSGEQKIFVVTKLACFAMPGQVLAAFEARWGWKPSPQSLAVYDPTNVTGALELGPKLTALFHETRQKFRESVDEIAIASQTFRLIALNRLALRSESAGDFALAAAIHEQAAKEIGGAFSNLRRLGGPNGEALPAASGAILILPHNYRNALTVEQLERSGDDQDAIAAGGSAPAARARDTRAKLLNPARATPAATPGTIAREIGEEERLPKPPAFAPKLFRNRSR